MGWKEQIIRQRESGSPNSIGEEDKVARRVLRGLGLQQKYLSKYELSFGIEPDYDETLWRRTKRLLDMASGGETGEKHMLLVEPMELKRMYQDFEKKIQDIIPVVDTFSEGAVFLCSSKELNTNKAYVLVGETGLVPQWLLQPVATLVAKQDGYMIWAREIESVIHDLAETKKWKMHEIQN